MRADREVSQEYSEEAGDGGSSRKGLLLSRAGWGREWRTSLSEVVRRCRLKKEVLLLRSSLSCGVLVRLPLWIR